MGYEIVDHKHYHRCELPKTPFFKWRRMIGTVVRCTECGRVYEAEALDSSGGEFLSWRRLGGIDNIKD